VITRLYASPLDIPEKKSGKYYIRHGSLGPGVIPLVDMREALMANRAPTSVRLEKKMRLHQLCDENGVWMSDDPRELRQAAEWILDVHPEGRILVGGLGLGIMAEWLSNLDSVDHVDVVELSRDVIKLVHKRRSLYSVINEDLFKFLRNLHGWDYDYAFLDIWRGTSESDWWQYVFPLRRIIGNLHGDYAQEHTYCWAEDVMLGQIRPSLQRPHHWHHEKLPDGMSNDDVWHFTTRIGLPDWEERWGKYAVPSWGDRALR
jgi:hypothetical protein